MENVVKTSAAKGVFKKLRKDVKMLSCVNNGI